MRNEQRKKLQIRLYPSGAISQNKRNLIHQQSTIDTRQETEQSDKREKKLFDQPIYALFDIADAKRSTSRPPKLETDKHPNVEQPSVLNHFTRRQIDDRYPDEWIE